MEIESFAAFYRRYNRLIHTVAQQRLQGVADAEDVTADVFRIAWQHYAAGEELTLPWLYQVLRNVIGNEYRRTERIHRFVEQAGPIFIAGIAYAPSDDVIEVRNAMRELPAHDRDLLYMTYWEDLTAKEVASILGFAPGTIRVRLLRARRRLKSILESRTARDRTEADDGRT